MNSNTIPTHKGLVGLSVLHPAVVIIQFGTVDINTRFGLKAIAT